VDVSFVSAFHNSVNERKGRETMTENILTFGIKYFDDAMVGIFPGDLILLGAPSGVGKTQICCNIALANILKGKKVHYIALEAEQHEIERRIKYPLVAHEFFKDPNRPRVDMTYSDWMLGINDSKLEKYEAIAAEKMEQYKNLFIYYKRGSFGVNELISTILSVADESNLIILDHVHYLDFEDDNENRAIKQIAKITRDLAIEEQTPIIMVAHLRKKDKFSDDLIAGLEEFHGSSDLYKIATKVITMSPGQPVREGEYETFFRIPKNRLDGGVTRYSASCIYSTAKGGYEDEFKIGWAEQSRREGFKELDGFDAPPRWIGRSKRICGNAAVVDDRYPKNHADNIRPRAVSFNPSND
jgi:KaiC/GvpD/RAD55 family RecA-like ATPase